MSIGRVTSVDVSIVVPCYNCGEFIAETLNSIFKQTVNPREVIVIDDGSTDDTQYVLGGFGSGIVAVAQPNQGVSSARNRGIDMSCSKWLMFLDADDLLEPHGIERLLAKSAGRSGVIYGHRTHIDESGKPLCVYKSRDCTGPVPAAAIQNFGGAAFPPGCALVRRDIAERVRFRQVFAPCEDRDFWIRCGLVTEFAEIPQNVLFYRERANSHSKNRLKQVIASVEVRLAVSELLQEQFPEQWTDAMTPSQVIESTLLDVYWRREWGVVATILESARRHGITSNRIDWVRRRQLWGRLAIALKDCVERQFAGR